MHNIKKGIKKLLSFTIISLSFLIIPTILPGMEADKNPKENSESYGGYDLVIKGNDISLKAKGASLKNILEEIGRRMKIEVFVNIPQEVKITIALDMMYLGDALKKFKKNYAYITESDKDEGKIIKIVVVPKGDEKMLPYKYEYNPQPPIQEYNPQPPIEKFEHEHQPTIVRSEKHSQTSSTVIKHSSQPSPIFTESDSQSSSSVTEDDAQLSNVGSEYDPQPPIIEK
jgi:hypothetical protein